MIEYIHKIKEDVKAIQNENIQRTVKGRIQGLKSMIWNRRRK